MWDVMTFPKTMKEFIDGFSFNDSDEVYTNGTELIPVFRVEQAMEHYEQEIRNKAIDEFVDKFLNWKPKDEEYKSISEVCYEIAEQMKGGE